MPFIISRIIIRDEADVWGDGPGPTPNSNPRITSANYKAQSQAELHPSRYAYVLEGICIKGLETPPCHEQE